MNLKLLAATFSEGLLSFFSPCVLPLIPLYMSYLAGDNKTVDEEGNVHYRTGKVFLTTLFFVLGICLTFVLLAVSLNFVSAFLETYNEVISTIGGVLLIIFGLHELGFIRIDLLSRELRPKVELKLENMNCFKAFLFGFLFSLGWSPCIGPMLSNALLLASTSSEGYLHLAAYGLGLVLPFLITGLFTDAVLNFISKNRKFVSYVSKIAGIVLILFGCYMIKTAAVKINTAKTLESETSKEDIGTYLINYEFKDGEGNTVKLADHHGEYILLNFSATWCQYCEMELPDLEKFSEDGLAKCYIVMSPLNENNGMDDITKYLEENNLRVPVIIDEEGVLFYYCSISSYPTSYIIDPDGHFSCYSNGAMSLDGFHGFFDYAKGLYEASDKE